jgi:NADPH2:quinone reductase
MRALQVQALSEDLSGVALSSIARPQIGPGQVLIRVKAASVNFPDLLMARGAYQVKPPLPFTLGGDLAGDVVDSGPGSTRFAPGDQVMSVGLGAFADYVVRPEETVERKPAEFTYAQAAAFGAAYLTAHVGLVERGVLQPGDWVLVHGAAGGMGLAAVDLARALGGRVIACSTSDRKLAAVENLYAPEVLVNSRNGFRERVLAATGGRGADVIFDPVNGAVFEESVRCVAFDGRLLVVGFAGGQIASLKSNQALIKGFSVVGVRAGEYARRSPERRRRIVSELTQLARENRIRPHVDASIPLEDWRAAFLLLQTRQSVGKVVLELD